VHRAEDITAELLAGFPPNFIVKAAHGGQMTMAVGDGGRTATCHGFCGKGARLPKNLPQWAAPAAAGLRERRDSLSAFLRKYCANWLGFNYSTCVPTYKRGCLHFGIKGNFRGRPCPQSFCRVLGGPGYAQITPACGFEERLYSVDGLLPLDLKLFTYHFRPMVILFQRQHLTNHSGLGGTVAEVM